MRKERLLCTALLIGIALFLNGCGSVRDTLPPRSAMEQLVISTAADRAVSDMDVTPLGGRAVFIDQSNLQSVDQNYLLQRTRAAVLLGGARLVETKEDADLILEMAAGALSIDRREMLFGIPALPLPVQFGGEVVELPEIPLWKTITYNGRAKLLFSVIDAKTGSAVAAFAQTYGNTWDSYWWLLIVGPFRFTDLPKEER